MKIIVTGALGVLGGAIVEALNRRGDRVAALVHEPRFERDGAAIDILYEDLADPIQAASAIAGVYEGLGGIDALVCVRTDAAPARSAGRSHRPRRKEARFFIMSTADRMRSLLSDHRRRETDGGDRNECSFLRK